MIKAGYALLTLGFLGGAFLASLDAKVMMWNAFLPFFIGGVVGVWMIKEGQKRIARASHVLEGNRADIEASLKAIVGGLEILDKRKEDLPTYEMRFEIDRRFRADLNCFAEARESLIHLYGLNAYAEVMSAFAAGERYLNRVWSASADGYVDETRDYLGRALTQFREALGLIERIDSRYRRTVPA